MGKVENQVTKACYDYLRATGHFVWRSNTRVVDMPGKGGKTYPMRFGIVGGPDITGVLKTGKFIGVEVKKPLGPRGGHGGSKQTLEQMTFQAEDERCGGVYVLARSLEDLIQGLATNKARAG